MLLIPGGYRFFIPNKHGGYLSNALSFHIPGRFTTVALFWIFLNITNLQAQNLPLKIILFLLNTLIANYFFIFLRHSNIGRGMGAPGYFTYFSNFIGLCVSFGAFTNMLQLQSIIKQAILILLGGIFVISGLYKLNSGFTLKDSYGLNVGLCNEMWSRWPNLFMKIPPKSWIFKTAQFISSWGEIFGGLLLITGYFSKLGAVVLIAMFLGIGLLVRLGLLIPQLIFCLSLPFVDFSSRSDKLGYQFNAMTTLLIVGLYLFVMGEMLTYIIFLSQSKIVNFKISRVLYPIAIFYSKYFGTILWRVFTPDITSLHINIFLVDSDMSKRKLTSWDDKKCFRYRYVGEAITVASIFTSLRYWPSNYEIFKTRILSYARTLNTIGCLYVIFEVSRVKIDQQNSKLDLVSLFVLNLSESYISEHRINYDYDLRAPEKFSRIRSDAKIGEYDNEKEQN